jgi:hypothetical protein
MLKLRVPHWEGGHVEDIRNIRDNLDQETVYYDVSHSNEQSWIRDFQARKLILPIRSTHTMGTEEMMTTMNCHERGSQSSKAIAKAWVPGRYL